MQVSLIVTGTEMTLSVGQTGEKTDTIILRYFLKKIIIFVCNALKTINISLFL